MADSRALALILFQKFHKDLPDLKDDPSERVLGEVIVDAINLLPDYVARPGNKKNLIQVRQLGDGSELTLNIQEFIDSLQTLWNEYKNR